MTTAAIPSAVDRARGIVSDLRGLAAQAERERRLPLASVKLVHDAGLFRSLVRREVGGDELPLRSHVEIVATLAEGDGATAWVVGIAHAHAWLIGHLPIETQREVYGADPDTLVSAVIGPRGKAVRRADGSYVLNGFWPFGSGCERSSWLMLGAEVFDASGSKIDEADFLLPTEGAELKDDWHVAGLQGTGSCSIAVSNAVVPARRMLSLVRMIERSHPSYTSPEGEALVRSEAVPVLTLCICSGALGLARGALAEYRHIADKPVAYTPHMWREWIPNQTVLGEAASQVNAAEMLLFHVADEIDAYAGRNEAMPIALRARIRGDCSYAVRLCLEAAEALMLNAGASSLALRSPLQRAARDLRATNMHGLLLLDAAAELYGRVLLGLEPNTPII
jgi:3-hydroxy-9,10-secoandrosta-1,3,5(10)-triene-9,17-dione monooxygenase